MMVAEGLLNKQIAFANSMFSEATIKAHVTAIFRKSGVQNRIHRLYWQLVRIKY